MQGKLYHSGAIEVKGSPVHGYGVFATRDLQKGEVLEECYYLALTTQFHRVDDALKDYVFLNNDLGTSGKSSAVVLGSGMIYNHRSNPNVLYKKDKARKVFIYYMDADAGSGEELFVSYGEGAYSTKRLNNG